MHHHLVHRRPSPLVSSYVDGGVALVASPYDRGRWQPLREGWWWHVAAMVLVPPYAVVALVVWQRPSGQGLARRTVWAVLAVLGALSVVGLGAFVLFSRRWYWWHRAGVGPEQVACAPSSGGPLAHRAADVGRRLADLVTREGRRPLRPGMALPLLGAPWGPLRDQVATAAVRVHQLGGSALGPAADVVGRASREAAAAFEAAREISWRAAQADASQEAVAREVLAADLMSLGEAAGDPEDLELARRSLHAQLAVVERVDDALARTEGRLRRLAAQAGEVAARAEELVWSPTSSLTPDTRGLEHVTDELASVRIALEQVHQLDLEVGVA